MFCKCCIETFACGELVVVEERADSGFVKCINCFPLLKVNINGRGNIQQRIKQHINSEAHRKSKCQKHITIMFAFKRCEKISNHF